MNKQVLLDKLSEFLMVEQCGWQLYRVVESRATDKELKERNQEFGQETDRHRTILTRLIGELGGDPDYLSPTARIAQAKSQALLASGLVSGPLGQAEREASNLENVLLAETMDHADWELLGQLAEQLPNGKAKTAIEAAVAEVGSSSNPIWRSSRSTPPRSTSGGSPMGRNCPPRSRHQPRERRRRPARSVLLG